MHVPIIYDQLNILSFLLLPLQTVVQIKWYNLMKLKVNL